MDKTQKLCKRFPFYCFTCYTHFFYDNKIAHENHSFVDLKKIEIKEDVIINSKKNIKKDANKLLEQSKNAYRGKKYESELINFISLVIKEYENEKSNFYNLFNFVYLLLKRNIKLYFENKDILLEYYYYRTYKLFYKELKEEHFREYEWRRWRLRNIIEKKSIIKMELQIEQNRY